MQSQNVLEKTEKFTTSIFIQNGQPFLPIVEAHFDKQIDVKSFKYSSHSVIVIFFSKVRR
jgi:hypothetical protein